MIFSGEASPDVYKGPKLAPEHSNSPAGWSRVSLSLLMIMDDWDLFYHFSDEEDWEDALLARAYDRCAQLGGGPARRGPLFEFHMQPIGRRRRWREVVERAQFNAQLRQLRDPVDGDDIGLALTEALHQAIEGKLEHQQRPAHHFVNFAITAHGFMHAYQSANFTVGEFLQRAASLDDLLAQLSGKLNSNESFNPTRGFQVDVVFVSMPGPGSGRGKKRNPGRLCLDENQEFAREKAGQGCRASCSSEGFPWGNHTRYEVPHNSNG